ncbi:hypothetical protein EG328_000437 [Venturia inaequalis]|uniref:VOC domain-containing protein n=1 Tax=Venturia inaequalis TaxID=5025 RepID=A0A8H3ZA23_VENIN|nr:hypothetical protein EG328_000437 [Venturia inaequalis]KAE9991780.1 hypothetical protein EG327_010976 [Venturia inaequalis]
MLDHLCLRVPATKFTEVVKFYTTILAPLGYKNIMHSPSFAGFGVDKPYFSIVPTEGQSGNEIHLAFSAKDRAAVEAFYEAGVGAGAKENGKPGYRPYHEHYFGAFVIDPVGNNIEACVHDPE